MKLSKPYDCAAREKVWKVLIENDEAKGFIVGDGDFFIASIYSSLKFSSAELRQIADLMDGISGQQKEAVE